MDVFRFVKRTPRANDPTRRYLVGSAAGERVGDVEVAPPRQGAVALTLTCSSALSDAARHDVLVTARRFLDELARGWGAHPVEGPAPAELREQPDGRFAARLEFEAV